MKRLFTCIMMALALGLTAAQGQKSGTCGSGLTWTYGSQYVDKQYIDVLTVSGTGAMDDYGSASSTPWGKAGYTVEDNKIDVVVIGEGVTRVGNYAFSGSSSYSLTTLELPSTLESIGECAFYRNGRLYAITLPVSLKSLEESAFSYCTLRDIVLPPSLETIGISALYSSDDYLNAVYVTGVQPPALADKNIFGSRSSNAVFYVPAEALAAYQADANWSTFNLQPMPTEGDDWSYADGTLTVSLYTDGFTAGWAGYAYDVTTVVLQNNLDDWPDKCFKGFSNIKEVYFESLTPPTTDESLNTVFAHVDDITFYVPGPAVDAYREKYPDYRIEKAAATVGGGTCGERLTWKIDKGVLAIGGTGDMAAWASAEDVPWHAYRNGVVSVKLPVGITSIGAYAFADMGLAYADIEVPEGCLLQRAEHSAFRGVDFPYGEMIYFGNVCYGMAFPEEQPAGTEKYNIQTLVLREGTVAVMNEAFGIESMAIREAGKTTSYNPLEGVEYVLIPRSVTAIGERAFYALEGLEAVTVPESVVQVGDSAWGGCRDLSRVTWLPASCELGDGVFHPELEEVEFGKTVRSVPARMLAGNTGMASVAIPHEVETVGDMAFFRCSDLSRVALGAGVTRLGENAFSGCSSLTTIQSYALTPPAATPYCFLDVPITASVQIPCGCIPAYEAAPEWEYFWTFTEIIAYNATGYSSNEEWGTVSVEQTCAEATFLAEPADGCRFLRWSNGETANPLTVDLHDHVELMAEFAAETTGVDGVWADGTEVYGTGNTLFIRGNDSEATVYDTTGRMVYRGLEREIILDRSGVYIVEIDGRRAKVVI